MAFFTIFASVMVLTYLYTGLRCIPVIDPVIDRASTDMSTREPDTGGLPYSWAPCLKSPGSHFVRFYTLSLL